MAYHKMTSITGFDTLDRVSEPRFENIEEFMKAHYRGTTRRGHWNIEACLRLAAKLGIRRGTIEHRTSDTSGMGRGSFDASWDLLDGAASPRRVSEDENREAAATDLADVWE